MKNLLLVVLTAVVAGCSFSLFEPDFPRVEFATAQPSYSPGDTVEVRLKNVSRQRIGYNLCFVDLEKKVDNQWSQAPVIHRQVPTCADFCG